MYTEPIDSNSQLQISYNANYQNNYSDKLTYDWNVLTSDYSIIDSILSNRFDNDYFTQRAGLGYRLRNDNMNLDFTLNYQRADLISNQEFPNVLDQKFSFDNFLPSLRFRYKFSQNSSIRMNYRTNTQAPSMTQLQNVVDNTNSLQLTAGNPNLEQQVNHSFITHFMQLSQDLTNMFMAFININLKNDYITNSTYIAANDTIVENGILLPAGGQLTKPINSSGYFGARTFSTMPLYQIGSLKFLLSSSIDCGISLYEVSPRLSITRKLVLTGFFGRTFSSQPNLTVSTTLVYT